MRRPLEWLAVVGNVVFILWMGYNAIDSGFRGTVPEIASVMGLAVLLILDSILILGRRS